LPGRADAGVMDHLAAPVVEAARVEAEHAPRVAIGEVEALLGREAPIGARLRGEGEGHAVAAPAVVPSSVPLECARRTRAEFALELGERDAELVFEQRVEEIVVTSA